MEIHPQKADHFCVGEVFLVIKKQKKLKKFIRGRRNNLQKVL